MEVVQGQNQNATISEAISNTISVARNQPRRAKPHIQSERFKPTQIFYSTAKGLRDNCVQEPALLFGPKHYRIPNSPFLGRLICLATSSACHCTQLSVHPGVRYKEEGSHVCVLVDRSIGNPFRQIATRRLGGSPQDFDV